MNFRKAPFHGQSGDLAAIAFSPDDRYAVTGGVAHQFSLDRSARVWEIPSGRLVEELKPHSLAVYSVAYSPDGTLVATGGGGIVRGSHWVYDNCIRIWDVSSGKEIRQFGHELFFVKALAFSPDGQFLASGSMNDAPIAPHRDGRCLRLWDWQSGREVLSLGSHVTSVDTIGYTPDGRRLVSGSNGMRDGRTGASQTLRLFETDSGGELEWSDCRGWVNSVSVSGDGRSVLSAGHELLLWSLESGELERRFDLGSSASANCGALAPNGRWIVLGSGGHDEPGAPYLNCSVSLLNVDSGALTARWEHDRPVSALAVSHDSRMVLAGEEGGTMRLWETPEQ
jgi:WD40 repeat protein